MSHDFVYRLRHSGRARLLPILLSRSDRLRWALRLPGRRFRAGRRARQCRPTLSAERTARAIPASLSCSPKPEAKYLAHRRLVCPRPAAPPELARDSAIALGFAARAGLAPLRPPQPTDAVQKPSLVEGLSLRRAERGAAAIVPARAPRPG